MNRRNFLQITGAGAAAVSPTLLAVPTPYQRQPGNRIQVGLAAYSFRGNFRYMKGKENKRDESAKEIDMPGFIEFCANNGAAGAELTSYFFPPEVDATYLANCRKVAHINGVAIAGTAVGNNFSYPKDAPERAEQMDYVKQWIDHSSIMGAPHIRVFAGKHPKGVSAEDAEKNAIEALEEAADYAGQKGIFLGIENHDSVGSADRLLRIVQAVKSPWVGVNLDSGNFRTEDPYADMEASAPFTINVQLKTKLKINDKEVDTDWKRVARILKESGYSGFVILEYEEKGDPFSEVPPILEELNRHF